MGGGGKSITFTKKGINNQKKKSILFITKASMKTSIQMSKLTHFHTVL
jgi:hypothetical protein